ncbi:MAG: EVE domain-containing protein [Candidatus Methanomethylicia archaeon]
MIKKYWIFIVDDNTWPEHLRAGIAAINKPPKIAGQQSAIAEIIGVKPGDLLFFNLRVSEIHPPQIIGLYEVTTYPYYDESPISPEAKFVGVVDKYRNPYRVGFKQVVNFSKPLDMDQIWLLKDKGLIWSIQQSRGNAIGVHACISITVPEGKIISKMLKALNPIEEQPIRVPDPPSTRTPLPINLSTDHDGSLHYESALDALLIKGLSEGEFKNILGDYDDFIPFFLTPARYEIDVLLLKYDGDDILWYGIIETKAKQFTGKEIIRLINYENWFVRTKVISPIQVHSIALAYDHKEIIEYARKKKDYDNRGVKLVQYRFDENGLSLSEVPY